MVRLVLTADFKRQVLQLYGATVPMKEPRGLRGNLDLNNCEMREVVIQTVEIASAREEYSSS